jgi:hypothetical protein
MVHDVTGAITFPSHESSESSTRSKFMFSTVVTPSESKSSPTFTEPNIHKGQHALVDSEEACQVTWRSLRAESADQLEETGLRSSSD